jgi:hypothetical protein
MKTVAGLFGRGNSTYTSCFATQREEILRKREERVLR